MLVKKCPLKKKSYRTASIAGRFLIAKLLFLYDDPDFLHDSKTPW